MAIREDPEENETAALKQIVPSIVGARVLEIGCGDGRLTGRYADSARSILAIDPDADAIAELTRRLPRVQAYALGVEQLDIPTGSIDVVLFSWSL
jgi:16S rRNA A1518/A1519 N6-dimethyltransferase RsmA/KsgA/DIM1 with predicted DNA glycosylase/AP lyase activity